VSLSRTFILYPTFAASDAVATHSEEPYPVAPAGADSAVDGVTGRIIFIRRHRAARRISAPEINSASIGTAYMRGSENSSSHASISLRPNFGAPWN
jgi:hypothetical protein